MAPYTNVEIMRALFDNHWVLGDNLRAPSAHLDRIASWHILTTVPDPVTFPGLRTIRTVNFADGQSFDAEFQAGYLPDDLWVQCGIQFRMKQMVVIDEEDPLYVRRVQPDGTGFCSGGGAIGCGQEGALIQHFMDTAGPLLEDPSARTVIFNYRIHSQPCIYSQGPSVCCGEFDPGVTCNNNVIIDVSVQRSPLSDRRFVLSHELGHSMLSASGHSNDATHCQETTPNLMCPGESGHVGPHMPGCEIRQGAAVSPPPTNCVAVPGDARPQFSCDDARANVGGAPVDSTPPVVDAGPDQSIECTSPAGATATLSGAATDPETGIVGDIEWGVVLSNAPPPNPSVGPVVTVMAPIASTTYQAGATNGAGNVGLDFVTVTVTDSQPPVLAAVNGIATSGCQTSNVIALAAPAATDVCSVPADVHVTGAIIQANGVPLNPPQQVPDTGMVTLTPGAYLVRWTATDHAGLSSSEDQTVDVAACISVGQSMSMADRSQVIDAAGVPTMILNYGAGGVDVGVNGRTGSIVSAGPVTLRDHALVAGDVRTASTLTIVDHPTITGSISQNVVLNLPVPPAIANPWPSTNKGPVSLEPNQSKSITPGTYTTVNVKTNATLTLGVGTYFMDTLTLEPLARIKLGGATTIEIRNSFIHRGSFRNGNGSLASVAVRYRGTASIPMEAAFNGSVLAPNATLRLGLSTALEFHGQFFARRIELRPDVRLFSEVPPAGGGFVTTSALLSQDLLVNQTPATRADAVLEASSPKPGAGESAQPRERQMRTAAAWRGGEEAIDSEVDSEGEAGLTCTIRSRRGESSGDVGYATILVGVLLCGQHRRRTRATRQSTGRH